eukprot:gnl/MRDRNA2_/MRDRNA2_85836_c0_seq4.p1 gnl/MRDRNA2_/MRDRNA2_85836_c0~~gnl/MRDRNA2_/MRDRNA2_85836_c0_seq4.p1  ORF type:complete len:233 (+),score=38.66 gnl/MRDRNA2_/MRDRNA2_85836_c0_seq4:168-866(+)
MFAPQVEKRFGKQQFGSNKSNASVSTRASSKECSLGLSLNEKNLQIHNLLMDARQSHECCANHRTNAIADFDAIPWMRDMLANFDPDATSTIDFDAIPGSTYMMENFHLNAEIDGECELNWTGYRTRYMKEKHEALCTNPLALAKAECFDHCMGGAEVDITDSMKSSTYRRDSFHKQMPRVSAMVFSPELLAEVQINFANREDGAIESDSDTESLSHLETESHFADDEADLL